jgi:hypothetical protein
MSCFSLGWGYKKGGMTGGRGSAGNYTAFFYKFLNKYNMKRIFFRVIGVIGVAAFAVVVALNINASLKKDVAMDVTLANVEALVQGETTITICLALWGQCISGVKAPFAQISN